MLQKYIL